METKYTFHIEYIENGRCQKHDFEGTPADFYWFIAQLPEDARINSAQWKEKNNECFSFKARSLL